MHTGICNLSVAKLRKDPSWEQVKEQTVLTWTHPGMSHSFCI